MAVTSDKYTLVELGISKCLASKRIVNSKNIGSKSWKLS